ncbi:mechanosensitive ion channel family protein [Parvibaculum sp.]|uniref:mechanosensitive ion channel family protein n=1 Tax=Parvibaculum sp. TaxID=2024848 RepID=UPI00391CA7E1
MQGVIGNFEDYWELVKDVWQTGVLGHSIGDILVAVAIFGFFYVLRGLFTRFVLAIADRWVERTESKLDDYIRDAVKSPLRFLFLALGFFFATEYLDFGDTAGLITENLNRSLIVIAIFWALYNCVGPVSQGIKRLERVLTPEILDWLIAGAKTAIVLIAIATILQTWGIQVAPIIAGLGLFGVAVALGAQDLFKNLIGGMSILIERRFGFGDWIKVDGVVEGNVERIGFRSTLVRQFDKAPVYVPNQHLSDNAVTNYTAMTYRRISWIIGVEYRTTHEQLQRIVDDIRSYIETTDDFVQPPLAPLFVRIDSFGASSIDIMVYCFTRTTVWGEWLAVKEALAYRIKQIVEGAGTGFAFPSRSIYVETMPPSPEEIVAARKE